MSNIRLLVLVLLLCSQLTFAGSGGFYFKQVGVVRDNGQLYGIVQLDGQIEDALPACAEEYRHQITFLIEDELGKLLYSNALTAVVSQKSVWMTYSDATCGLWGTRPLSSRIDIRK